MTTESANSVGINGVGRDADMAWADQIAKPTLLNLGTSDADVMAFMTEAIAGPNASDGRRMLAQMYFQKRQEITQLLSKLIDSMAQTARRIAERF